MNYDLKRPCVNCPFRNDIPAYLSAERVEGIQEVLEHGGTFSCHKTTVSVEDDEGNCTRTDTKNSQHCAGALILLEKEHNGRGGGPGCMANQMARFAARIHRFDPNKLDVDAPIFDSFDDMIAAQEE